MYALILRQLAHALGAVPADIQAQVTRLSTEQLVQLGEALFDFTSFADVTDWLQHNATPSGE
jgi:hypothetical protein